MTWGESRSSAWTWVFAFALLALSVELWLTDFIEFVWQPFLFMPFLAAYLGLRFGKRGLTPLLLASVFLIPSLSFSIESGSVYLGVGLAYVVLLFVITIQFARLSEAPPNVDVDTSEKSRLSSIAYFFILVVGSTAAGASIAGGYSYQAALELVPFWVVPIATFILAANARLGAGALIKGVIIFTLFVTLIGVTSELVPDGIAKLLSLSWSKEVDWTLPIDGGISLPILFDISWTPSLYFIAPTAVAAGFLGTALRSVWLGKHPSSDNKNAQALLHAALFSATVLPVLFWFYNHGVNWSEAKFEEFIASLQPPPEPETAGDPLSMIIVKGSRIIRPAGVGGMPNDMMSLILLGVSFGIGSLLRRRVTAMIVPLYIGALLGISALALQLSQRAFLYERPIGDGYFTYALTDAIVTGVAFSVLAALAVWLGRAVGERWRRLALGEDPREFLPAVYSNDLTSTAAVARRLDVSATIRAFSVFMVLVLSGVYLFQYVLLVEVFLEQNRDLSELFQSIELIAFSVVLVFVLASPLWMLLIDWMSRQPLRIFSGVLTAWSGAVAGITCGAWLVSIALVTYGLFGGAISSGFFGGWYAALQSLSPQQVIIAISVLWLSLRTLRVEFALTQMWPRQVLMGFIHRPNIGRRFAFLVGLPSSMWRGASILQLTTWLFLLSRPIFYVGVALLVFSVNEHSELLGNYVPKYFLLAEVDPPLLMAIGFGCILAGHLAFMTAKRFATHRIWGRKLSPSRNDGSILFLRSFNDDQLKFRRTLLDLPGKWLDLWAFRRNVDELLVDEFAQFGPIIALGDPNDDSPRFGAERQFVSNDDWQEAIMEAARRSRSIVIGAGDTPGLLWEYSMLERMGLLKKSIFLFPSAPRNSDRAKAALRLFSEAFPQIDLSIAKGPARSLIAVAPALGDRGVWTAKQPSAQAYLVALRRFFYETKVMAD